MFSGLSFGEILLIATVALIIFGPEKLPELGRSVGTAIREFRKASRAITEEVARAADAAVREEAPAKPDTKSD